MNHRKHSPKRAFRLQAGVKPLQEQAITLALKGRKNILSPLWGWGYTLLFTGVLPLPVVLSGLRPLGWETLIIIIMIISGSQS